MPSEFDPKSEYPIEDDIDPFRLMSGRQMFEQVSYTGINRSPIVKLRSFIEAGLTVEPENVELPFEVTDISERLLVDGTVIWYEPEGFLADIVSVTEDEVIMKIRDADNPARTLVDKRRVMTKTNDTWQMRDEEKVRGAVEWTVKKTYDPFPDDPAVILIHENGMGLLYWAQFPYLRIEEIQAQLRRESSSAKTKTFVHGYTGDLTKMDTALKDKTKSVVNVPGNVNITSPYAAGVVDNLLKEKSDLLIQYDELVMDFITNEAVTMSGISRRLMMSPMLQYVKGIRGRLTEIFEKYKAELQFDKVQVQTIEERTAEYNLLKTMLTDGVLERDDFETRAMELG